MLARVQAIVTDIDELFHVGTLNVDDKGVDSYEGCGLSVSVHPDEWAKIARLGDDDPWVCDARKLRLVDGHRLLRDAAQSLLAWGVQEGLASECVAWQVDFVDDYGDERSYLCASTDEADAAADDCGGEIQEVRGHAPSEALCERMLWRRTHAGVPSVSIAQDLATVWAEDAGYDGIWWEDELDVWKLSAPRGVIFPAALATLPWRRNGETRYAAADVVSRGPRSSGQGVNQSRL